LQSVFMLIDWCDTLHFEVTQDGCISRTDVVNETGKPLPEQDLSVRAALALQAACGTRLGVRIGLEKRIPSEAGMGGGSSDAAATLLALNALWGAQWSLAALAELGLKLGADVPFFLYHQHAWVEGVGEKITPIVLPKSLQNQRFLVIKPLAGVPTPAVFSSVNLVRDTKTATIEGFAAWAKSDHLFGRNDLQPVALGMCSQIAEALNWLESLGLDPRMTGSGSAVFAQVSESFDLECELRQVPSLPMGWVMRLCSNEVSEI
jgi:4-diphosphocytidyl-2-C-methyl-D-erythritol kinase